MSLVLVLTRKLGEQIVIGNNIRLTVVGIRGERVRLAVRAPPETRVRRGELHGDTDEARGQDLPSSESPDTQACPH
jgi:carbon storage regulator CsrA